MNHAHARSSATRRRGLLNEYRVVVSVTCPCWMLYYSRLCCKPKTLAHMLRKLKLAGAHPDVLWGIDAEKAQHNGEAMIRLETLLHQRETNTLPSNRGNEPERFLFWLRSNGTSPDGSITSASSPLQAVQCVITPLSHPRVVKQQLSSLFDQAGVLEDFEIGDEKVEMNLESVLRDADERQTQHIYESGSLYIRGDKSVEMLRRFGVLLVIEEDGVPYLVTLPEIASLSPNETPYTTPVSGSGNVPCKSIIGPNGEVSPDVQDFMNERGMRPFDLRMAGSHSSVERFVTSFERLERMYEVHRGRAMRTSVCIVISLTSSHNYVASDGCIILSVRNIPSWEEYLLSLPQDVWRSCVQQHQEWRIGNAPKLHERKRQLMRVADMFHVYRVTVEVSVGCRLDWQSELVSRLLREETIIRRAVQKYNLKSALLKRRGEIRLVERLYSAVARSKGEEGLRKEIGYRVVGDGTVYFNQSCMTTGQMLRVMKDNLHQLEAFRRSYDTIIASLEHLSRSMPVDFSVDSEWKDRVEGNLVHCLSKFVETIKKNEGQLRSFLHSVMQPLPSHRSDPSESASRDAYSQRKRMVWVISDKHVTMPSGVVFIPYDVDFGSIQRLLLSRR